MKHAMNCRQARLTGTRAASLGWTQNRLEDYLVRCGYKADGLTARRARRAFEAQVARG